MAKLTTGDRLAFAAILLTVFLAGVGATVAYGSLTAAVKHNTDDIQAVELDIDGITPAIGRLEVAIGKLETAIDLLHKEPE